MTTHRIQLNAAAVVLAAVMAFAAAPASAQTTTDLTYQWPAPTTGSPVAHYVVEHSVDGGTWTQVDTVTTNQYVLTATYGQSHRIRVAAVDSQSRQGPWSEASDPYTPDAGAPGQPGKPIIL